MDILNKPVPALLVAVPAALAYGVLARLIFQQPALRDLLGLVTIGFTCLAPLVVGALVVLLAPRRYRTSIKYALLMPVGVASLFLIIVGLFTQELLICLLMAAPFVLALAVVGGLLVSLWWRRRPVPDSGSNVMVLLLLLSPYLFTPLENQLPTQRNYYIVETAIVIEASPEVVWENIIRVPEIQPAERRFSAFHLLGVPQPLEAHLLSEGVGGERSGRFAGGLLFAERITVWEPQRQIRFEIEPHHLATPRPPLDQIGGPYYDIQAAAYTIEPLPDGSVRLYLSGDYSLRTHFNGYGRLWMDFAMRDFQNYVLSVVKTRSENSYSTVPDTGRQE